MIQSMLTKIISSLYQFRCFIFSLEINYNYFKTTEYIGICVCLRKIISLPRQVKNVEDQIKK